MPYCPNFINKTAIIHLNHHVCVSREVFTARPRGLSAIPLRAKRNAPDLEKDLPFQAFKFVHGPFEPVLGLARPPFRISELLMSVALLVFATTSFD